MIERKNRKNLPVYGKIAMTVDIEGLQKFCIHNGYCDYSKYSDVKYGNNKGYSAFLTTHSYCKDTFFKEDSAESLQGEMYKQLYLTDLDPTKIVTDNSTIEQTSSNKFSRTKRKYPDSANYIPEADEYNYGKKNNLAVGVLEEVMNKFKSPVCRVRLAVLMPGFNIKPHVDYDPSYITRYHIPIFTNPLVKFGAKNKNVDIEYQMLADGGVYFFNSGLLHWVGNNGNEPRLHLIVDTNGQEDLVLENDLCFE